MTVRDATTPNPMTVTPRTSVTHSDLLRALIVRPHSAAGALQTT